MTKECELLLAIVARQNCGSAYNIAKKVNWIPLLEYITAPRKGQYNKRNNKR
jgi:hypothetical protein